MQKVAFVGLGAMGQGMADNLHQAGLLTAVWNRTQQRVDDFVATHAGVSTPLLSQLGEYADVVVTCVSADEDLMSVVDVMLPSLRTGVVIIDCSTVSALTARQIAELVQEQGVSFLDCPVSGGTEGANNGSLAMMVGGDVETLASVQPVLLAMGSTIEHMGGVGAGQATKAVNQIMAAGINQAVTEALAFGVSQGLPMDKVIDVVGSGAAGNWFLSHRGKTMLKDEFPLGFKLALHHKDLKIAQTMAADVGMLLNSIESCLHDYEQLMKAGYGEEDISSLFRRKRKVK